MEEGYQRNTVLDSCYVAGNTAVVTLLSDQSSVCSRHLLASPQLAWNTEGTRCYPQSLLNGKPKKTSRVKLDQNHVVVKNTTTEKTKLKSKILEKSIVNLQSHILSL